jgi:cytochrome c oxidase subunit 4
MSTHSEAQTIAGAEHAHKEHAHGGPAAYARTLVALLILTGITIGAAYIDLGSGNIVVALLIATIKASLVALFFMHLRWEKPVNGIIAMSGFLFLAIFLMFSAMDENTRNYYLPQNLHRTEVPLAPGTAPLPLTEILPDPENPVPTGASPVPGAEAAAPAAPTKGSDAAAPVAAPAAPGATTKPPVDKREPADSEKSPAPKK